MKRMLFCQCGWLFAVALRVSAIDFTPRFSDTLVAGVVHRQLFFVDGRDKVTLNLGIGTKVEAGGGGAVFRFPAIPGAMLILKPSPLAADEAFSASTLERYREAALRLLPEGTTEVTRLAETEDPFPISGWHSYSMAFAFEVSGARQRASVTFANVNKTEQIVAITLADEAGFDDATEKSWSIIRTWHSTAPE